MKITSLIKTCEYIEVSDLVPESWVNWFWDAVSEDAPFSWGDNNRSLVCACDFRRHCKKRLNDSVEGEVTREEIDSFLKNLRELGVIYIDLEN